MSAETTYKGDISMYYFSSSIMKNLFINGNNLHLFEETSSELLRSKLVKKL